MKGVALFVVMAAVWCGCGVGKPGEVNPADGDFDRVDGGAEVVPGCLGETYPRKSCNGGDVWRCNPLPGGGPCRMNDGRVCVAVCP